MFFRLHVRRSLRSDILSRETKKGRGERKNNLRVLVDRDQPSRKSSQIRENWRKFQPRVRTCALESNAIAIRFWTLASWISRIFSHGVTLSISTRTHTHDKYTRSLSLLILKIILLIQRPRYREEVIKQSNVWYSRVYVLHWILRHALLCIWIWCRARRQGGINSHGITHVQRERSRNDNNCTRADRSSDISVESMWISTRSIHIDLRPRDYTRAHTRVAPSFYWKQRWAQTRPIDRIYVTLFGDNFAR